MSDNVLETNTKRFPNHYKILLICGSAQEPSLNERYLSIVAGHIEAKAGYSTETALVRTLRLPLFLGYETSRGSAVEKWRAAVEEADGFVLACPEYDHALPAVLKNAFEHLDGSKGLADKPVFLLGASTGQFGTLQAQHSVYPILRTYRAWLLPDEMFIPRADQKIDGNDSVTDQTVAKRLKELTDRFTKAVELFASYRQV